MKPTRAATAPTQETTMRKIILTGLMVLAVAGAGIAASHPAAAFMRRASAEGSGTDVRATTLLAMMRIAGTARPVLVA
jgi:hypothetical protein